RQAGGPGVHRRSFRPGASLLEERQCRPGRAGVSSGAAALPERSSLELHVGANSLAAKSRGRSRTAFSERDRRESEIQRSAIWIGQGRVGAEPSGSGDRTITESNRARSRLRAGAFRARLGVAALGPSGGSGARTGCGCRDTEETTERLREEIEQPLKTSIARNRFLLGQRARDFLVLVLKLEQLPVNAAYRE